MTLATCIGHGLEEERISERRWALEGFQLRVVGISEVWTGEWQREYIVDVAIFIKEISYRAVFGARKRQNGTLPVNSPPWYIAQHGQETGVYSYGSGTVTPFPAITSDTPL
jgi:hypothetical protein